MSLLNFWFDTETKRKRGVAYPGYTDFNETVSGSAKTVFQLAVDIDSGHAIDAWVDGRLQEEGVAWTRDNTNNRVTFTSSVAVGSWVRVRVINK